MVNGTEVNDMHTYVDMVRGSGGDCLDNAKGLSGGRRVGVRGVEHPILDAREVFKIFCKNQRKNYNFYNLII